MADDRFKYLDRVKDVQKKDHDYVDKKDRQYGSSWKKRGGVGAFMMLARKWDRLETMMSDVGRFGGGDKDAPAYDIFAWIRAEGREEFRPSYVPPGQYQGRDGTILAEVRDLRRYLTLVEAWAVEQGWVQDVEPAKSNYVQSDDVYSVMAQYWEISRDEAKRRIIEKVYGEPRGVRAAAPAQAALNLAPDRSELSAEGASGGAGIPVPGGGADDSGEPLNASDYVNDRGGYQMMHQRQPINATGKEYTDMKNLVIPAGTLGGGSHIWASIYNDSPEDDGRWLMRPEFHEEYGQ